MKMQYSAANRLIISRLYDVLWQRKLSNLPFYLSFYIVLFMFSEFFK